MSQSWNFDHKAIILKEFDRSGYFLRPSSLTKLLDKYTSPQGSFPTVESFRGHIKTIIDQIKTIYLHNINLDSNLIDDSILEEALKMLHFTNHTENHQNPTANTKLDTLLDQKFRSSLVILDALHEFPDLIINQEKENVGFLGAADDKIHMFNQRFLLIREQMMRDPRYLFARGVNTVSNGNEIQIEFPKEQIEIHEIGSLIGFQGQKNILGLLIEPEHQIFYLQDNYSKVKLDISRTQPSNGFICVGNVYIAEGEYLNDIFVVQRFFLPKHDNFKTTADFFGAKAKIQKLYGKILSLELEKSLLQAGVTNNSSDKRFNKLRSLNTTQQVVLGCFDLTSVEGPNFGNNKSFEHSSVAIFSNFLFTSENLAKFELVLKGFESLNPVVFVLMGEFSTLSEIKERKEMSEYLQNIENFLNIVKKFPKFCMSSSWLFVAGTGDLGMNILPREGLPQFLYEKIQKVMPLSYNCTNPCRAAIFGKEFVFCRVDLIKHMRRHSVLKIDENVELDEHFAETLISQSHLCPISLYSQPIYWKFDACLNIRKFPDFLVVGDSFCKQFKRKIGENCEGVMMNPGNFAKATCFNLVYPLMNVVELCKINK